MHYRIVKISLGFTFILFIAVIQIHSFDTNLKIKEFSLEKLEDVTYLKDSHGNQFNLFNTIQGKICVIRFWSATCGFTNRMNQDYLDLYKKMKENILLFDCMSNWHDDLKKGKRKRLEEELTIPLIIDSNCILPDIFGVDRTPEICILDTNGHLVYQGSFYLTERGFKQENCKTIHVLLMKLINEDYFEPFRKPSPGCPIDKNPVIRMKSNN